MTKARRTLWARLTQNDRRPAWREVAERLGGEMEEGGRTGSDRALFRHGPWRIALDTYAVSTGNGAITYTRAQAHFRGHRDLRVTVRKRNAFDGIWSALGFGDPLPVARDLLKACVVKGKPAPRVPSLFSSPELVEAIVADPSFRLEVKPAPRKSRRRFGTDTGVVTCRTEGVVTDVDRLAGMVRVVRHALDALHRVGEANQEEVGGA
jgi:hypothetical protein